jgi:murein DD-endopeptidase MepM/ murein hydrolase activator NlpD
MEMPNIDDNGVDFLGSTINVLNTVPNKAQGTLDKASQTISNITQLNAKAVNDTVQVQVNQNLNRANQLRDTANPFQQLGVGLVKGVSSYYEGQQNKANEALQKSEVFKQKAEQESAQLTREMQAKSQADSQLLLSTKLREYNQSNKWGIEGGTGFITEIETALKKDLTLTPDAYASALGNAYRVVSDRESAEANQAAAALDKLQSAVFEQRKPEYLARAIGIGSKLKYAGYEEDLTPYENMFSELVIKPISVDGQLTEVQKLLMMGAARDEFIKGYPNYYESQDKPNSALRQWDKAYNENLAIATEFEKTNDYASYKAKKAAIDLKYPLAKEFSTGLGESRKVLNDLSGQALIATENERKVREANPIKLSATAIKYFASQIILDPAQAPSIRQGLANDAVYAEIETVVKQYGEFNAAQGQLGIEAARTNEEIIQLQANTANDVFQMSKSGLETNNSTLNDTVAQILAQTNLSPEQRVLVQTNPDKAKKDIAIANLLDQHVRQRQADTQRIISAKKELLYQKQRAETSKYDRLNAYGLYGASRQQLQRNVETLKEPSRREVDLYNQGLLERARLNNSEASLNGQQPNFSSGGSRSGDLVKPVVLGRVSAKFTDGDFDIISPIGNGGKRSGRISSPFGMRSHPVHGGTKMHSGADFAAPLGTPVINVVSGVVVNNKPVNGYGNTTLIKGDDGFFYHYAHSMPRVQIGQRVDSGQHIADVDGSGTSTGAHLHFEVRTQGVQSSSTGAIDPLTHLRSITERYKNQSSNVRGLRQDTTDVARKGYVGDKPTVVTGDGTVVVGQSRLQSYTAIPKGYAEHSTQREQPTAKYNTINRSNYATTRVLSGTTMGNAPRRYANTDNYGYAYLATNPQFRVKLHQVAERLGTHPMFLADIISQESQWTANLRHDKRINPNNNVGLVGFGNDSFDTDLTEKIVRTPALQQLDYIEKYVSRNIPPAQRKDIRTLWAGIKMGTIMRNRYWKNPNVYPNAFGKPYWKDIKDLGRDAGREYLVPGYDKRRSSLEPNYQVAYGTGISTLDVQLSMQGIKNVVIGDA